LGVLWLQNVLKDLAQIFSVSFHFAISLDADSWVAGGGAIICHPQVRLLVFDDNAVPIRRGRPVEPETGSQCL